MLYLYLVLIASGFVLSDGVSARDFVRQSGTSVCCNLKGQPTLNLGWGNDDPDYDRGGGVHHEGDHRPE
jgi:hypothetical protein